MAVVRWRSEGRHYFHGPVELKVARGLAWGDLNIWLDAGAFNQTVRWCVPGSARDSHKEIVADGFRITADHPAGSPRAHNRRQMFIGGECRNSLTRAGGRFIDQQHRSAMKRIGTKALCGNLDRWVRELSLIHI